MFTATLTAGGALGLVLGGVLTTTLGWRWCLYVNVAVSLVAIIGGRRVLPMVAARREVRIDLTSAALASAGMAALVYGLGVAASAGWGSGEVAARSPPPLSPWSPSRSVRSATATVSCRCAWSPTETGAGRCWR